MRVVCNRRNSLVKIKSKRVLSANEVPFVFHEECKRKPM